MNLQQLYYFKVISELKNYTKASKKLLVAQSSLSHSISNLEEELGVPLFYKIGRNIEVTEYGIRFLIYVKRIINELDMATQEMQNMLNPNMGKIRIAMAHTVINHFIPAMIKNFYANPENQLVQFEFSEKQAYWIQEAFRTRSIDLGFGAKIDDGNLEFFPLFNEEMIAIVSSKHPLASCGSIRLHDLCSEPLVTYSYDCGTRLYIDEILKLFQLKPNIIQEVKDEKMMAGVVAAGLGVGIMPRIPELPIFDVVPLTLENSELRRTIFISWPKGETLRPVVKNFRDYVISKVQP